MDLSAADGSKVWAGSGREVFGLARRPVKALGGSNSPWRTAAL